MKLRRKRETLRRETKNENEVSSKERKSVEKRKEKKSSSGNVTAVVKVQEIQVVDKSKNNATRNRVDVLEAAGSGSENNSEVRSVPSETEASIVESLKIDMTSANENVELDTRSEVVSSEFESEAVAVSKPKPEVKSYYRS